jgi:hypothetical protein
MRHDTVGDRAPGHRRDTAYVALPAGIGQVEQQASPEDRRTVPAA